MATKVKKSEYEELEETAAAEAPQSNLGAAIIEVMKQVSSVEKRGRNDFHKYDYVRESDAINALRPSLIESGLVVIPTVTQMRPIDEWGGTAIDMMYRIIHVPSGEYMDIPWAGYANDRHSKGVGDKGVYKAMTGAQKYFLMKLFHLETDADPEAFDTVGNTGSDVDPFNMNDRPSPAPSRERPRNSGRSQVPALDDFEAGLSEGGAPEEQVKDDWTVPSNIKADDDVIKAFSDLVNTAENKKELDAIWSDNTDRLAWYDDNNKTLLRVIRGLFAERDKELRGE